MENKKIYTKGDFRDLIYDSNYQTISELTSVSINLLNEMCKNIDGTFGTYTTKCRNTLKKIEKVINKRLINEKQARKYYGKYFRITYLPYSEQLFEDELMYVQGRYIHVIGTSGGINRRGEEFLSLICNEIELTEKQFNKGDLNVKISTNSVIELFNMIEITEDEYNSVKKIAIDCLLDSEMFIKE